MKKSMVTVSLLALVFLAGCGALRGFIGGVQDELEQPRPNIPSITAAPETRVGYAIGSVGVVLVSLLFGSWAYKKKK